jgi:uncharacterized membrane protein YtjA (UPF0391 family)
MNERVLFLCIALVALLVGMTGIISGENATISKES